MGKKRNIIITIIFALSITILLGSFGTAFANSSDAVSQKAAYLNK